MIYCTSEELKIPVPVAYDKKKFYPNSCMCLLAPRKQKIVNKSISLVS